MHPERGELSGTIAAPAKLMAELTVLSLAHNHWERGTYNLHNEIVSHKKITTKASGIGYETDYSLRVSWSVVSANNSKVIVQVSEAHGNATKKECQQQCYDVIKGINERAAGLIESIKSMPPRTKYGDARWATPGDLGQNGYVCSNYDGSNFVLGPYEEDSYLALSAKDAMRHVYVCGPTGTGKSSTIFAPNIVRRSDWSALITEAVAMDEDPHLFMKTAGHREKAGHKIYYFNPNDLRSDRINLLDSVKTISDATRLANLIMTNTRMSVDTKSDPFWERNETALLTSLIMHAALSKGHLGSIRQLIRYGPAELHEVMLASPSQEARERFHEFMLWTQKTEQTRNSIVMGLIQRLELWTQPKVVALTETTDIDFEVLKDELFTFYMAVPGDIDELKPCAALI
ncbi:MAG: type IV secretory system conjugative DNA transfer family protein, partial [Terriglobales bacterium]